MENRRIALFAFNGESMCFIHVLLNSLDLKEKGHDIRLIIEGSATRLLPELNRPAHPYHSLYREVVDKGLIDCVCQACAIKMEAYDDILEQGLPFHAELKGHPSFSYYLEKGYEIISM